VIGLWPRLLAGVDQANCWQPALSSTPFYSVRAASTSPGISAGTTGCGSSGAPAAGSAAADPAAPGAASRSTLPTKWLHRLQWNESTMMVFTVPSDWRTVRFRVDFRVGRIARQ
jgi:hypothetical protein